jgi:nitric oxide reductase NorD protein
MEETVGLWWHRAVSRWADRSHAEAAVTLAQMRKPIEMLFRAGGGSPGVRLAEAGASRTGGARGLLQKLAHAGMRAEQPRLDTEALALPPQLAVFDSVALNRGLYLWLAALASVHQDHGLWIVDNVTATRHALQAFPGLAALHRQLVQAHLAQRPRDNSEAERAVRTALLHDQWPPFPVQPQQVSPVWLWLLPGLGAAAGGARADPAARRDDDGRRDKPADADSRRHQAQRVADERGHAPFILPFRAESLLSWSELVRVDRATDDDENPDAARIANDLDHLSVSPDGQASASRVRFDLDLPSASPTTCRWARANSCPNGTGARSACCRRTARCRPSSPARRRLRARRGAACHRAPRAPPPGNAARGAALGLHGQRDGDELDLDAWVRQRSAAGGAVRHDDSPAVWHRRERGERHLATLLLADLSLSTEAHVDNDQRVIDVVRDALYVFGEALTATGDAFQMLGFSSVRRQHVRLQHLKGFDEPWNDTVRARLAALKPGYYTRMGAALRAATQRLAKRPERQRLLLLLTDGKPNDLDIYEGRYGLEDTREAVREARAAGLLPFAVTIDEQAADYLPQLFGAQGFALVRRPRELTGRLAQVYAQLTRQVRG